MFEILAVSKKEDDDDDYDDDYADEIFEQKQNKNDSKYFSTISQKLNSAIKRSSSVMEYYSNSGCYTCITRKYLSPQKNTLSATIDDNSKKFVLYNSKNRNI